MGTITLIGATTENPSFEVIRPLLSRCQVYVLKSLEKNDLLELLNHAINDDTVLKEREVQLKETDALLRYSGGDARKLLNILDLITAATPEGPIVIDNGTVTERLQQNPLAYDKTARCTTTSSRPSSRAYVAATPMPHFIGWHG